MFIKVHLCSLLIGYTGADPGFWKGWGVGDKLAVRSSQVCAPGGSEGMPPRNFWNFRCNLVHIFYFCPIFLFVCLYPVDEKGCVRPPRPPLDPRPVATGGGRGGAEPPLEKFEPPPRLPALTFYRCRYWGLFPPPVEFCQPPLEFCQPPLLSIPGYGAAGSAPGKYDIVCLARRLVSWP